MLAQEKDILIAFLMANAFIFIIASAYFAFAFVVIKKNRRLQIDKLQMHLQASEMARQDIATQLHNELGPLLSSVNMRLELVKVKGADQIEECQQAVSNSVKMIRQLTRELSPFGNMHLTLKMAVEHFIAEQLLLNHIQFNIVEESAYSLTPERSNQVYRVLQEIILNTIKHSKATQFDMEISGEGDQVLIRTFDNGKGFDLITKRKNGHMGHGLNDIFFRVQMMGGELECQSDKNGTRYHMLVPM